MVDSPESQFISPPNGAITSKCRILPGNRSRFLEASPSWPVIVLRRRKKHAAEFCQAAALQRQWAWRFFDFL